MATRKLQSTPRTSGFDGYRLLLFGAILLYTGLFTRLAFDQHLGMRTHKADLGQIGQAVWNSSRGRFVEMTDNGFIATRLTDHVEPILALVSPILWLWNDVRALLLLQVFVIALGAWPLYELALLRLDQLLSSTERAQIWHIEPLRQMTRPLALALALAYLLTPHLQSAVLTEFHAAPLVVPLVLWSFWAIETRRLVQFIIATLLVALVKEETALLAAGLGVWALWKFTQYAIRNEPAQRAFISRRHLVILSSCLLVFLLSLAWFYIATFVIVPAHAQIVYQGADSIYFERYGALGDSPFDIFKNFFTQPGVVWRIATEPARVDYLLGLLAPFGFLTLLAPEIILLALPVLLANLLSAYPAQYYGEFHYSAPLVPYFAVGAAYGLGRLWRWIGRRAAGSSPSFQHMPAAGAGTMALVALLRNSRTTLRPMLAALLGIWIVAWAMGRYLDAGRGPLAARYDPTPITAHHRLLNRFIVQLPADAAVTATAAVHPHVSHRRYVYQFPIGLAEPGQADWALLDVTTNTDMAPGDLKARVEEMLAGGWGVVDAADGFLLLKKGASATQIPDAFYDFARNRALRRTLQTELPLQLVDVQVEDWLRWRQTKVVTQWLVGPSFDPAPGAPRLEIVTPDGQLLDSYSQTAPPALVWYPPARWQAGEVVRIKTAPLALPTIWGVIVDSSNAATVAELAIVSDDGRDWLAAAYQRDHQGQLQSLLTDDPVALQVANLSASTVGRLRVAGQDNSTTLSLDAWLSPATSWPGGWVQVWLQWNEASVWPEGYRVFVHARQQDKNLVQSDGPPRFFIPYRATVALAGRGLIHDLRPLQLPHDLEPGQTMTIVIGLYDPVTGQRADVIDASGNVIGNELVVGQVQIGPPPAPDQTCALIAETCAAQ